MYAEQTPGGTTPRPLPYCAEKHDSKNDRELDSRQRTFRACNPIAKMLPAID
jgi:hypothetical protein